MHKFAIRYSATYLGKKKVKTMRARQTIVTGQRVPGRGERSCSASAYPGEVNGRPARTREGQTVLTGQPIPGRGEWSWPESAYPSETDGPDRPARTGPPLRSKGAVRCCFVSTPNGAVRCRFVLSPPLRSKGNRPPRPSPSHRFFHRKLDGFFLKKTTYLQQRRCQTPHPRLPQSLAKPSLVSPSPPVATAARRTPLPNPHHHARPPLGFLTLAAPPPPLLTLPHPRPTVRPLMF